MKVLISVAFFLLFAGCATPEEWATEVIATYGPYCDKLGYQRDTDQWRQCVQFEDAKHSQAMYYMSQPVGRCRHGWC